MQEQRPGCEDGRTKEGACRVADSLSKSTEAMQPNARCAFPRRAACIRANTRSWLLLLIVGPTSESVDLLIVDPS